jgi:hypothetical protein
MFSYLMCVYIGVKKDIRGQHVISAASEESNHIKIVLLQSYRNDLCLLLLFTFICC